MVGDEADRLQKWRTECREDAYIIAVQEDARESQSQSIFRVPQMLKRDQNDEIYNPQVLSLGPYHFLSPHLAEMEAEKSIVIATTVAGKLPADFFRPLQIMREGGQLPDLESQEDFFKRVLTKCKNAYGNHAEFNQNLDDETFSLMMFRDTSFLLVFLTEFIRDKEKRKRGGRSGPFDGLRSSGGHYLDVQKDVVKLENQIPLCALEALYAFVGKPNENFEAFVAAICSYYSPFWIQSPKALHNLSPLIAKATHLLHCIHEICVNEKRDEPSRGFDHKDPFPIAWIKKKLLRHNSKGKKHRKRHHPTGLSGSRVLPSAVNLTKAGVKFRAFEGGIRHIRFDWEDCTLYLPVVTIGILTETIMRNLIAFELCSAACKEKAVTSFVRLLDELIEGEKDVELLRRSGILLNWDGRDEKVASILKSLRRSTWKPYFKPINIARSNLCKFYNKRKLHILWSEFLEAYCSKPWVLISAVAATLLLLMTAAQVLCLFYRCIR